MKTILVPYFELNGRSAYPDTASLFSNPLLKTVDDVDYWQFDYAGINDLETGPATYQSMLTSQEQTIFKLDAITVLDNSDSPILFANGAFQPDLNEQVEITANIVDESLNIQTQLNESGLKVVCTRYVGNKETSDQYLLKCAIENGVLTLTGAFANSGIWRLSVAYNNNVLRALGKSFAIEHDDLEFWV